MGLYRERRRMVREGEMGPAGACEQQCGGGLRNWCSDDAQGRWQVGSCHQRLCLVQGIWRTGPGGARAPAGRVGLGAVL
jgi:hypothetical protein